MAARIAGIADGGNVNVVRANRARHGSAGRAVHTALDDGDHGQSLCRNMPARSFRDLVIKDETRVVAPHRLLVWILDGNVLLRRTRPVAGATPSIHPPDFG